MNRRLIFLTLLFCGLLASILYTWTLVGKWLKWTQMQKRKPRRRFVSYNSFCGLDVKEQPMKIRVRGLIPAEGKSVSSQKLYNLFCYYRAPYFAKCLIRLFCIDSQITTQLMDLTKLPTVYRTWVLPLCRGDENGFKKKNNLTRWMIEWKLEEISVIK